MGDSSNFDWWKSLDRVCEIAEEERTAITPITLDLTGKMIVPDTIDTLQFDVLPGKALILTRFEGYAFDPNVTNAAILTPPPQGVFPWAIIGRNDLPNPYFEWVSRTSAGIETIVMTPRPQSVMDMNALLAFPENQTAVLKMVDTDIAGTTYDWSLKAYCWLIPSGKITNFELIQSRFNANYLP